MAISRVAGQMLNTNLQRDGVNLSFSDSDLGNSTPTLFLDVGNNRVGINKSTASVALDVVGNIAGNSITANGIVSASGNITGANVNTSGIYSTGGLSLNTAGNGNILLQPNGTGFSKAIGTNGFVIPVGNTAQRPSPVDTGTIRFNTSTVQTEVWDGSQWVSATGGVSVITNQTLNGDGNTVTFNLDQSATAESILVSINGVIQTPSIDYTTNTVALTITFTTAPASGDVIQVRFIVATTVLAGLINGTSNVTIADSNGNVTISSAGVANVLNITSTGTNITGYANITGNISGANLSLSGNISSANITGNITANNATFGNVVYLNNILNQGGDGTGNIGNATVTFNTIFAKATSAQYADLAELYSADADYAPGTVVSFGGDREVTLTTQDADPCIAGVVSTNPSYIMNAGIFCEFPTQVALTGRVPCRVVGLVTKGAMMVAAGNGAARAELTPAMGTVIGKALEAFDGESGTIEIVVGRM